MLIHYPFPLPPFFYEEREKGERITSCRTFSDPIDFHPVNGRVKNKNLISLSRKRSKFGSNRLLFKF